MKKEIPYLTSINTSSCVNMQEQNKKPKKPNNYQKKKEKNQNTHTKNTPQKRTKNTPKKAPAPTIPADTHPRMTF